MFTKNTPNTPYESVSHTTGNENGEPEVTLEYVNGFIRALRKLPNKTETYVRFQGKQWRDKITHKIVSDSKNLEIAEAIIDLKFHEKVCLH